MEYLKREEVFAFNRNKGKVRSEVSDEDQALIIKLHEKLAYLGNEIKTELNAKGFKKAPNTINSGRTTTIKEYLWYRIFPDETWDELDIALAFSIDDDFNIRVDSDRWDEQSERRKALLELRENKKLEKIFTLEELLEFKDYRPLIDEIIPFYKDKVLPFSDEIIAIASIERNQKKEAILGLIESYKNHIKENGLDEELYKWELITTFKGRPDPDAIDFLEELKEVNFDNLVYHNARAVAHELARERQEDFKRCFKSLFNENNPLAERVKNFSDETLKIYREIDPKRTVSHHQDERTIATYLTYHNPDKYTFYKNSFYKAYCDLIGEKARQKNQKYSHYLELIDDLIENYIKKDEELIGLFRNQLPDNVFQDENYKIFAQDILYTMLNSKTDDESSNGPLGLKDQFIAIINELKQVLKAQTNVLNFFSVQEPKARYVWISGPKGIIGHTNAHYEIRRSKDTVYVELHFESKDQKEKDLFSDKLSNLPKGLEWIKWEQSKSIRVDGTLKIDTPDIVELLMEKLQFLETSIGDQIRKIITGNMPANPYPLNQILYGPPGTGKTYNSIIKAVEIASPKFDVNQEWSLIKEEYDRLIDKKQIVFTTFHQSMSYEDFVEGIKPIEPKEEGGQLSYAVEDGIFKKICKNANPILGNFEAVIEAFKKDISEPDEKPPITIKAKGTTFDVTYRGTAVFYVQPHASSKEKPWYPVNIDNIEKAFSTGNYEGVYNPTYVREIINFLSKERGLQQGEENKTLDNYVLIIDEINRGNISAIFGELITLIEENKRQGNKEAISVTLPYSKKSFSVPSNLFIIGTMNTADRSVEALDTALRRRFSFTEMPPIPQLIETAGNKKSKITVAGGEVDLVELLKTINHRIEILLDKDHLIGHSFFMKVADEQGLRRALSKEIIPLMQEYFFGDYGKVSLVLGEGFCKGEKADQIGNGVFAEISTDYDAAVFLDKLIYKIYDPIDSKMTDEQFLEALNTLMKTTDH